MKYKVYHLLTETEPFSEFRGGAISRWAANVLREDNTSAIFCPSKDDTWGFCEDRVRPLERLDRYKSVRRASMYLPWTLHKQLIRSVLLPGMEVIGPGDVLWVHNRPDYAFALAPFVHKSGARIVLHMHNSHLLQEQDDRIREAGIDQFVFVSRYLQNEATSRFPWMSRSTVLYNGADEQMFHPSATERALPDVPQILFASRLVKEKGGHIFLDAMRSIQESGVKAKGIIVGASHFGGSRATGYISKLHSMAPPNVEFRPYCSGRELAEMFREVDIFCLPSVWQDPFPLAPLEAMASNLPVVATHSGGIPEAVDQGGAILVERGSVEQLASALKQLIANPDLRKKIGTEGRLSFHRNFTWSVVQRRYHDIVSSLSA